MAKSDKRISVIAWLGGGLINKHQNGEWLKFQPTKNQADYFSWYIWNHKPRKHCCIHIHILNSVSIFLESLKWQTFPQKRLPTHLKKVKSALKWLKILPLNSTLGKYQIFIMRGYIKRWYDVNVNFRIFLQHLSFMKRSANNLRFLGNGKALLTKRRAKFNACPNLTSAANVLIFNAGFENMSAVFHS